jgi:hypothetical protein
VPKKFHIANRLVLFAASSSLVLAFFGFRFSSGPAIPEAGDVDVAFWSWRTEAPTNEQVRRVFEATNAKTLFQRAGQIDIVASRRPVLIRPVRGSLPSGVPLHLVYNGTPEFLRAFESLGIEQLSQFIVETFRGDSDRAARDGASVEGLQVDLDVPTRLLPRYAEVLSRVREILPTGTKLSITGLPTWMSSPFIQPLLEQVDFWIPQFYGAGIPFRAGQRIPISSTLTIADEVAKTAALGKPFYAGLSAYGYATLYGADGSLVELRGDIAPELATRNDALELVETGGYEKEVGAGEVMYVYRARRDLVLDGLVVEQGETLVFDQPTQASLRAGARAVHENGGPELLGICVFRIPTEGDEVTLSLAEMRSALLDLPPKVSTALQLNEHNGSLALDAANTGTVSGIIGEGSFAVDVSVPPGSFSGLSRLEGFSSFETLCNGAGGAAQPCSQRRANEVRFSAKAWKPSSRALAVFTLDGPAPRSFPAVAATRVSDGRVERETFDLDLKNN